MTWLTEIISSVNTLMPTAVVTGLALFYYKTGQQLKEVKKNILEVKNQNLEILSNYSAKEKIKLIGIKAEKAIGITDNELLLFIKKCTTVSLYFYDNLYINEFEGVTRNDVYKCSNRAIQESRLAVKDFSDIRFVKMFWNDFEDMAVSVQSRFIDIIEDEKKNGKHERFVRGITDFLTDLFEMLIKKRTEYFFIKENNLWDKLKNKTS